MGTQAEPNGRCSSDEGASPIHWRINPKPYNLKSPPGSDQSLGNEKLNGAQAAATTFLKAR